MSLLVGSSEQTLTLVIFVLFTLFAIVLSTIPRPSYFLRLAFGMFFRVANTRSGEHPAGRISRPTTPPASIRLAHHVVDVLRPLAGVVVAVDQGKGLADVASLAVVEFDDLGADDPLHRRGGDALSLHTLGNDGVGLGHMKDERELARPRTAYFIDDRNGAHAHLLERLDGEPVVHRGVAAALEGENRAVGFEERGNLGHVLRRTLLERLVVVVAARDDHAREIKVHPVAAVKLVYERHVAVQVGRNFLLRLVIRPHHRAEGYQGGDAQLRRRCA